MATTPEDAESKVEETKQKVMTEDPDFSVSKKAEYEALFAKRYTEEDEPYKKASIQAPICIENWGGGPQRWDDGGRGGRGGGRWRHRGGYRDGGGYQHRGRGSRGDWHRAEQYNNNSGRRDRSPHVSQQ